MVPALGHQGHKSRLAPHRARQRGHRHHDHSKARWNRRYQDYPCLCAGVALDYYPYIRDEEILDSIKTHVLKKVAGIGRFRRFTWRVRCERHRRFCRSS
jgi:hypothetical protein